MAPLSEDGKTVVLFLMHAGKRSLSFHNRKNMHPRMSIAIDDLVRHGYLRAKAEWSIPLLGAGWDVTDKCDEFDGQKLPHLSKIFPMLIDGKYACH